LARKTNNKKPGGSRYAALAILTLLILVVGVYVFVTPKKLAETPVSGTTPKAPPPIKAPHQIQPQKPVPQASVITPAEQQKPEKYGPPEATTPEEKPLPVSRPKGAGLLAIVIDDMGTTLQEARFLAGIGVPLTFSIIPGLRNYREVAAFASSSGIEIMIHIPMQSKGWPERRLESNGLLISMADSDLIKRVEGFVENLPKAVGANNHTGSEFTEHEDKMRAVLETLKGRGLFYIDSVTSPKTVGVRLAKELGLKSGRRQVFLDNEQDETYILGQLNQAVRLAKRTGSAIAICHPHPATIKTLIAALPGLEKQGITFVPASRLVK
jgi:polysaccharide deacetylase 2 family uncharacterized protein YibQ